MKRVRLVDVAREAGVSVGAASDALAGKNRIPESTRRRIRETADRLGYVPNVAAQALGSGQLPIVGLVIGAMRRPGEFERVRGHWAEVICTCSMSLADRGYALAVLPGLEEPLLQGVPFAGFIVPDAVRDEPDVARAIAFGVPVLAESGAVTESRPATDRLASSLPAFLDAIEARAARPSASTAVSTPD